MRDALSRLGLAPTATPGSGSAGDLGTVAVTPPPYRFDLRIEEDLIEEVVRLIGYDSLPTTPPSGPITARIRPEARRSAFGVRRQLAGLGYQETINFSFVDARWEHEMAGNPAPVKLLNPIASQMGVMRSTLLGSLLQVVKFNQDRKASRVRCSKSGACSCVTRRSGTPTPVSRACTSPCGWRPWRWVAPTLRNGPARTRAADFFDAKGDVEALLAPLRPVFAATAHPAMHPGRCASVSLAGVVIGFVGELHPKWRQAYELSSAPVMFELDLEAVLQRPVPAFKPVARHQPVERDIAVLVSEQVSHASLMAAIHAAPTNGLLRDATSV